MTSPSYPCRCRLLMLNKIILDDTDTHTHTRTHTPVGLPWTRDRSVVYISIRTAPNIHTRQTSMPPSGLETEIPASELPLGIGKAIKHGGRNRRNWEKVFLC